MGTQTLEFPLALWDTDLITAWLHRGGCRASDSHSWGPHVQSAEQASQWGCLCLQSLLLSSSLLLLFLPLHLFSCIFWTCVVESIRLNWDILQPCGIWQPIYMQFCKCILCWNEVTNLSSCMCALWVWKILLGEWIPFWSYHMFLVPSSSACTKSLH